MKPFTKTEIIGFERRWAWCVSLVTPTKFSIFKNFKNFWINKKNINYHNQDPTKPMKNLDLI